MEPSELDETDRGILHLLQQDARNNTTTEMADQVGVAPNTVRNRIGRLEENGVITGYHPQISYENAGFQLHVIFICTVSVGDRASIAEDALNVEGVIDVTEILSGQNNLHIEAVASNGDELTDITTALEELNITVNDQALVNHERVQPFDQFGLEEAEG